MQRPSFASSVPNSHVRQRSWSTRFCSHSNSPWRGRPRPSKGEILGELLCNTRIRVLTSDVRVRWLTLIRAFPTMLSRLQFLHLLLACCPMFDEKKHVSNRLRPEAVEHTRDRRVPFGLYDGYAYVDVLLRLNTKGACLRILCAPLVSKTWRAIAECRAVPFRESMSTMASTPSPSALSRVSCSGKFPPRIQII
jgi:hypothetical protein